MNKSVLWTNSLLTVWICNFLIKEYWSKSWNWLQVSISSTFYAQLLHTEIPKAHKDTDSLTKFLRFYDLRVKKLLVNMMVKLTTTGHDSPSNSLPFEQFCWTNFFSFLLPVLDLRRTTCIDWLPTSLAKTISVLKWNIYTYWLDLKFVWRELLILPQSLRFNFDTFYY